MNIQLSPSLGQFQRPYAQVTSDKITGIEQSEALIAGQEELIQMAQRSIQAITGPETQFEVSFHKPTNSIMFKVIDKETKEVIREMPSEKVLDLVAKMMEIAGLIVDKRI